MKTKLTNFSYNPFSSTCLYTYKAGRFEVFITVHVYPNSIISFSPESLESLVSLFLFDTSRVWDIFNSRIVESIVVNTKKSSQTFQSPEF